MQEKVDGTLDFNLGYRRDMRIADINVGFSCP